MPQQEHAQRGEAHMRDRRIRDESVAVDPLMAVDADQITDDAESRQNHDVNSRVGIDPEKVLVKKGIPPLGRIEKSDAQYTFAGYHEQGNTHHRSGKKLYPACPIKGPGE